MTCVMTGEVLYTVTPVKTIQSTNKDEHVHKFGTRLQPTIESWGGLK